MLSVLIFEQPQLRTLLSWKFCLNKRRSSFFFRSHSTPKIAWNKQYRNNFDESCPQNKKMTRIMGTKRKPSLLCFIIVISFICNKTSFVAYYMPYIHVFSFRMILYQSCSDHHLYWLQMCICFFSKKLQQWPPCICNQ